MYWIFTYILNFSQFDLYKKITYNKIKKKNQKRSGVNMFEEISMNKNLIRDSFLKERYNNIKKKLTILAVLFPLIITLIIGMGLVLFFYIEGFDLIIDTDVYIPLFFLLVFGTVFIRALIFGFIIKYIVQWVYRKKLVKKDRRTYRYVNCNIDNRENIKTFFTDSSLLYQYDRYNSPGLENTESNSKIKVEIKYSDVERLVRSTVDEVLHVYCNYEEEIDNFSSNKRGWYHLPLVYINNMYFIDNFAQKTGRICEIIEDEKYSLN